MKASLTSPELASFAGFGTGRLRAFGKLATELSFTPKPFETVGGARIKAFAPSGANNSPRPAVCLISTVWVASGWLVSPMGIGPHGRH